MIAIFGAVLINFWLILDCVDGNLARSVNKQPFGEFADGISSYILVGLLGISIGVYVFNVGGVLFKANDYLLLIFSALASESDTLMRLIYQKYKNTEAELINQNIIKKVEDKSRISRDQVCSLKVRLEMEFGIGGILPIMILLCTIFNSLDIVIIYMFFYYFISCILMSLKYIFMAIKNSNC